MSLLPPGDTQKLGQTVTLRARMVNVQDSIYFGGRMIITRKLVANSSNALVHVMDTLALIQPIDSFTYLYSFTPKRVGYDTLKGQLIFQKDLGEEIKFRSEVFAYPFYVVE